MRFYGPEYEPSDTERVGLFLLVVALLLSLLSCTTTTPTEPQAPRDPVEPAFTFRVADWADGVHPDTIVIYVKQRDQEAFLYRLSIYSQGTRVYDDVGTQIAGVNLSYALQYRPGPIYTFHMTVENQTAVADTAFNRPESP